VSLLWYARDSTDRRRRRRNLANNNNTNGEANDQDNARSASTSYNSASSSNSNNNNPLLHHSTSFMDTVKQSVEDAVEDIKSRIGELPSTVRRHHWPWDTIHKNKSPKNSSSSSSSSIGEEPDPTMKLTPNGPAVRENPELCIGSIFGLDVGGTLAKLVYFEQRPDQDVEVQHYNLRERLYHRAASAQAVLKARRGHNNTSIIYDDSSHNSHDTNSGAEYPAPLQPLHHRSCSLPMQGRPLRERSISVGVLKRRLTNENPRQQQQPQQQQQENPAQPQLEPQEQIHNHHRPLTTPRKQQVHSSDSNDDLENLYKMRQESVPDDLDAYASSVHYKEDPRHKVTTTVGESSHDDHNGINSNNSNNNNDNCDTNHPGRGLQRSNSAGNNMTSGEGSGMKKSRSMFDLSISQKSKDHAEALNRFYHFARKLDSYREGVKDHKLSFYSRTLGGEFHFIRFETRRMENATELIRANDLHLTIREMGATGGGAHKYAADWDRLLGIQMVKQEELDSLVAGMQFVLSTVVGECYTFRPRKKTEEGAESTADTSTNNGPSAAEFETPSSPVPSMNASSSMPEVEEEKKCMSPVQSEASESSGEEEEDRDCRGTDEWWWSRKVQRDSISYSKTYPYLLVTIGTGVSILRVDGPRQHERISGSTIGGGTYWGLIRLLTDLEDFEDVMRLAEHGDPSKVDMLVGDIYGNNKEALEKLGLPASLVASSFGKLVSREDPAAGLKQEDLARALLLMVTNNIGQVAHLNAQLHNTPRIYFVGNFLRGNKLSQRRLSFAINYWSKGQMEALFLEHEGYFGALGAFLLSQDISCDNLEPRQKTQDGDDVDEFHSPNLAHHRRSQTLEEHNVFF